LWEMGRGRRLWARGPQVRGPAPHEAVKSAAGMPFGKLRDIPALQNGLAGIGVPALQGDGHARAMVGAG
jgi:hypothetical protein